MSKSPLELALESIEPQPEILVSLTDEEMAMLKDRNYLHVIDMVIQRTGLSRREAKNSVDLVW